MCFDNASDDTHFIASEKCGALSFIIQVPEVSMLSNWRARMLKARERLRGKERPLCCTKSSDAFSLKHSTCFVSSAFVMLLCLVVR